jgi:cytochrome c biogenesis factor
MSLLSHIAPATPEELAGLRHIQSCRKRALITLWVTIPPLFLAYVFVNELPTAAVLIMVAVALVACGTVIVQHLQCRCPRCGAAFNMTKNGRHVWASACAHCGLLLKAQP